MADGKTAPKAKGGGSLGKVGTAATAYLGYESIKAIDDSFYSALISFLVAI